MTATKKGIEFVPIPYEAFINPRLEAAEKLLLGRLRLFAGRDGRCNPSHATLARELCVSGRYVRTLLASLRRQGWLTWQRTPKSCLYTLLESPDRNHRSAGIGTTVPGRPEPQILQKDVTQKIIENKNTDIDCLPTHRKERGAQAGVTVSRPESKIKEYPALREMLRRYMGKTPSDRSVVDILAAADGASEREVIESLAYLYNQRGLRPGTLNGPESWSWFQTVLREHFGRQRERDETANPCGYDEWEGRNDTKEEREQFARMTGAIELPAA